MRHILDRDDPSSAIPAALIASIAFASYPDTTVALYVMWKMLQVCIIALIQCVLLENKNRPNKMISIDVSDSFPGSNPIHQ